MHLAEKNEVRYVEYSFKKDKDEFNKISIIMMNKNLLVLEEIIIELLFLEIIFLLNLNLNLNFFNFCISTKTEQPHYQYIEVYMLLLNCNN